ncbi:CDP-archaeol synthase [Kordia jejudonensis]|uniref:CDP-archaeol synthase n=1 Tax=Kordia jejudonensis TaxID=1348245 RepID=UPI00069AE6FB|nr:CDP-archaeol synthase [Kordia jejudonensis]
MMHSFLQHIGIILLPLIIANVMHMIVIKKDVFQGLTRPISTKLFGANKTWRGFVFVPFLNALLLCVLNFIFTFQLSNAFFLGFVLGLAYMFFELPNSFLKRKLGIQPGAKAASNTILFTVLDKTDSAFGVSLTYFLLGNISFQNAVLLFVCSSCTHMIISQILVQFQLKKSF